VVLWVIGLRVKPLTLPAASVVLAGLRRDVFVRVLVCSVLKPPTAMVKKFPEAPAVVT